MSLHDIEFFLSGSSFIGIVAHAVSTFPVPDNPYAKWLLGTVQWIVGQREQAQVTVQSDEKK
jgi:hypothetical protein